MESRLKSWKPYFGELYRKGKMPWWYCGCLTGNEECSKERQFVGENLHTFGFEEGRSATEIPSCIFLMAAAAQEWWADLGFIACSMDVETSFWQRSNAGRSNLQGTGRRRMWHLLPGSRRWVEGGQESPPLFNMMMRGVFKPLQEKWKEERWESGWGLVMGSKKNTEMVTWFLLTTAICMLLPKEKIRKMIADTTEELRKGGVHWKEDQMEVMAWEFEGKMEMFFWRLTAESTELGRAEPLHSMEAMITKEALSVFRWWRLVGFFWMEIEFYKKNKGHTEENIKDIEKWCSLIFHTLEKDGAGTKRWWVLCTAGRAESHDLLSLRKWIRRGERIISGWQERDLPKEVMHALSGWCYSAFCDFKEKIFYKKMTRQTDQMVRDILRRADFLSRDQRSTNARLLGPRNQNKMKRRSAGFVHTNLTALWWKRSGCQRWWESCKGWESFVKAVEELSAKELWKGMRAKRHNAGTEMIDRMEKVRKKMTGKRP